MSPPVITKSMALAYLERAVAEKGREHRVTECRYFDLETGEPICIVGFVFHYHGYKAEDLPFGRNETACPFLGMHGFNALTEAAATMLEVAQQVQDGSHLRMTDKSWGAALDAAKAKATEIEGD